MSDQLKLFDSQPVLFYRGYKVFPSHIYHENQTAGISCCASKPWLLIFFTYAENGSLAGNNGLLTRNNGFLARENGSLTGNMAL